MNRLYSNPTFNPFCTSIFSSGPLRWCHPKPFQRSMLWQCLERCRCGQKTEGLPSAGKENVVSIGVGFLHQVVNPHLLRRHTLVRGSKWDFGIRGDLKNKLKIMLLCFRSWHWQMDMHMGHWVNLIKQYDVLWWQAAWLGHPNQVCSSLGETYDH